VRALSLLLCAALANVPQVFAQGALKIVVIEGEGSINVIQQKTAVRPVVEVRDRNNLPVAGATVTFAIQGGNAATFAGGAQTFSVVTNAAGQAAAPALQPLSTGVFQIQVRAAFQGQTVAATLAQTNVMTAAEVSATSTSASGAGTAGASGGGGISGGVVGGVAGAVAGAAAVVVVLGKESDEPGPLISVSPVGQAGIRDVTEFTFSTVNADQATGWDFGDGTTASGAAAQHRFSREGTFQVVATFAAGRTATVSVRVASLTGTWLYAYSRGFIRLTLTQSGSQVSGTWVSNFEGIETTSPVDGTLSSPLGIVLFQRGNCNTTVENGRMSENVNVIEGAEAFGNPICNNPNPRMSFVRQ
jgi:hypothetical protein